MPDKRIPPVGKSSSIAERAHPPTAAKEIFAGESHVHSRNRYRNHAGRGTVPASAQAQTPPGGPPPGSQVPVGNWVITYIEVAPGSEAEALAALKALKAASTKDNGYLR